MKKPVHKSLVRRLPLVRRAPLILFAGAFGFGQLVSCGDSNSSDNGASTGPSSSSGGSGAGASGSSGVSSGVDGGSRGGRDGGGSSGGSGASSGGSSGTRSDAGDAASSGGGGQGEAGSSSGIAADDSGAVACSNTDKTILPVDMAGWVDRGCNNFGIQGAFYCYADAVGTSNCPSNGQPYSSASPGPGMCLSGTTGLSSATGAYGGGVGLSLNEDAGSMSKSAYNAQMNNVVGFTITIAGDTGNHPLRIQFTQVANPTTSPFVTVPGAGTYDVLFPAARVPLQFMQNPGMTVDPTSIYDVQVAIAATTTPINYNYCITAIKPIVAGSPSAGGPGTTCNAPVAYGGMSDTVCGYLDTIDPLGNYGLQNDVWNPSASGMQCVTAMLGGACSGFTVSGGISNGGSTSPASYPALVYGWQAGNFYGAYQPANVKQLSAIGSVPTSWTYTVGGGSYDASYDMWLATTSNPGKTAGLEFMVWLASGGGVVPNGSSKGTASIWGQTWTVYAGSNTSGTPYIAYKNSANGGGSVSGRDLNAFFSDAVANANAYGIGLTSGWYLLGVQAGFEIWGGGSGFGTSSFEVSVQ